jgi:hypothetical protein
MESVAAFCGWGFVEPEDKTEFFIKVKILCVIREIETRQKRSSGDGDPKK